ncbi:MULTISPECIES: DUF3168 domain-containing protein [unclassified Thalassospira]|uniref:DUF3168 domain-containing protein n=1 Tax=unclassified Thalassospira TaxID=2648997 RepID=UPI0007A61AB6|nr:MULTISPECIES: DUF3168 domain-containing protein [unclassified Thalassospira]KZC99690.1 hypothetical protein AUQ41_08405 [Thalassospira sp. MCCC 1A02898]ONH85385.1 hypothetical protein TH47_05940 [Thalassospira sp. MCCC 1A02803]
MDASWPVQKALFSVLDAALECDVHDNVPSNAQMPYVVIGDDTQVPEDTKTSLGFGVTVTLHVWSDASDGRREAKQLLGEIYGVLHDADLTIDGMDAISCRFEFSETIPDVDDRLTHGVARYRIGADKVA